MNDRERLIELIGSFLGGIELTEITPPYGFENLADYLIANGVTVQKQGRWEHLGGDEWRCSNCGEVINTEGSWEQPIEKHCVGCGAKMEVDND